MGHKTFSRDAYRMAREQHQVTSDVGVTRRAEEETKRTGKLSYIVDPAKGPKGPLRESKIRLDPYLDQWLVTVGCPIDIEVTCDTTGSMGGEVDTEMRVLPDLYEAVAKMLPGYDPQLCLGIFGDCEDPFVMCRPQFEMEAGKIVEYLKEMAPQRGGWGNGGEDPQYAMFARAYLTNAYTNRIGLKGYHFVVTDEPCHPELEWSELKRIFGKDIADNPNLAEIGENLNMSSMVKALSKQTHNFVLVLQDYRYRAYEMWRELYGHTNVIIIPSTEVIPQVISAIIGLTEGTLEVTKLSRHLGKGFDTYDKMFLVDQLSGIPIGAQMLLRHQMSHPVPKKGDIFRKKEDLWPIQPEDPDFTGVVSGRSAVFSPANHGEITYL